MAALTLARDILRVTRKYAPDISPHVVPGHLANYYRSGVQLNNVAFENSRHRKIHMEVALVGMVKHHHVNFFPRPQYDAPIVTMDLVTVGKTATYALFDPSPVTNNLSLPPEYEDALKDLQERHGMESTPRKNLRPWAREIFSRRCVVQKEHIDQEAFCAYVLGCIAMHLEYCNTLEPSKDHLRIRANHMRYCRMQLKNERMRTTLASAFEGDLQLTNEYMNTVLFDC